MNRDSTSFSVTSGVYERKFTISNKTYHHILDRNTGYPIKTNSAGLTVVSRKSIDGEIWTGRLFGKTPAQIIRPLDQLGNISRIVVTKDGNFIIQVRLNLISLKLIDLILKKRSYINIYERFLRIFHLKNHP